MSRAQNLKMFSCKACACACQYVFERVSARTHLSRPTVAICTVTGQRHRYNCLESVLFVFLFTSLVGTSFLYTFKWYFSLIFRRWFFWFMFAALLFYFIDAIRTEMWKFISSNNYDVRLIVLVWQRKNHLVRCSYKCFRYIYHKSFERYSGKHYLDYYQLIDSLVHN